MGCGPEVGLFCIQNCQTDSKNTVYDTANPTKSNAMGENGLGKTTHTRKVIRRIFIINNKTGNVRITYWSVCACVHVGTRARERVHVHTALLIQHATRMRHIVTSFVAPRSPFFDITS
jgi:hypothetical protein